MANMSRPEEWTTLTGEGGLRTPFHPMRFDKHGACTSPEAVRTLVESAPEATDIFLFSHGWNNDWATVKKRYGAFITQFAACRRQCWTPPDRDYRPLLAGVFWPSVILVAPWEQAPEVAGEHDLGSQAPEPDDVAELAESLPKSQAERFIELARRDGLDEAQTKELAALLAPVISAENDDESDELGPAAPLSPEGLVKVWNDSASTGSSAKPRGKRGGFIAGKHEPTVPTAAVDLGRLDPRKAVRTTTVLLMKDRAGRVGGRGVASLLRRLLEAAPDSRVHLIGHSYGGKVVLSALCAGAPPVSPVESVLLLQPALSCLCFASDVDGRGRPGGYRSAPARCRQPIVTTYSRHDVPLTKFFHHAARRKSDFGEAVIAADGDVPSRYAALGGYGPQGIPDEVLTVDAKQPPDRYDLSAESIRVVAVKANDAIGGHGDVTNPATAWALLCQVMG